MKLLRTPASALFRRILLSFFLLLPASSLSADTPAVLREIKIKAAVTESFKTNPAWENEIKDRILYANKVFEPALGIHFSLKEFIPWKIEDERREMDLLIEELRTFIPLGPGEMVIGFHQMSKELSPNQILDHDTVGSAQYFKGFAVIRDPFQMLPDVQRNVILVHELAHIFGAIHSDAKDDMMAPQVPSFPVMALDQDNLEIMRQTRNVDFIRGLESLSDTSLDQMIRIYERRIRTNPHADFYHQLGLFYRRREQPAKAIAIWEEALKYHYANPYIHYELGYHYFLSARYRNAVREIGSSVSHFVLPSQKKMLATALNFLGAAYHELGNTEDARIAWLKALANDPDNAPIQGNLAVSYLQAGDLEKGITELQKLIARNANDHTLYSNLGVALIEARRAKEAVSALQKALELQSAPRLPNAAGAPVLMGEARESDIRLNLGVAYLLMQDFSSALEQLRKVKALTPAGTFDLHRNTAQAYLGLKQYEEVIKEIKEALRYKRDDPYLYGALAQAYTETKRRPEAYAAVKEGLRYAQKEVKANLLQNLAMMYAQDHQYGEAVRELKMALNENWKNAEAHYYLGELYLQQGNQSEGKRSLKTALQIDPSYKRAKERLEQIS